VEAEPTIGLSLSVALRDATAVVTVGGEVEYGTAPQLRTMLLEFAQGNTGTVVLDMAEVKFLDSSGISLLIQAQQRFDAEDRRLVLRHPSSRVTRVLEVAGVADMFTVET